MTISHDGMQLLNNTKNAPAHVASKTYAYTGCVLAAVDDNVLWQILAVFPNKNK